MTRRKFATATAAASASLARGATGSAPGILELRTVSLRNGADTQRQRMSAFIQRFAIPALVKHGAGPVGVFSNLIAPDGPYLFVVVSYPSLAAMEETRSKVNADADYLKGTAELLGAPGLPYERIENSIVRMQPWMPSLSVGDAKTPSTVFELRTYESNSSATLRKKIKMFEDGEMAIFRKLGMKPVFLGETIIGKRMPNLVYMLGYDNLAAREKTWGGFGKDPEWAKLRDTPGLSDAEIVSNIHSVLLSPLGFSQVR
jgi:NIPSNAP